MPDLTYRFGTNLAQPAKRRDEPLKPLRTIATAAGAMLMFALCIVAAVAGVMPFN